MNFAKNIFERATVKGVADYLLYGMVPDRECRSYETRLDEADLEFEKVAKQFDEDGASVLLSAANALVNENASVYMELGLQAGLLLVTDWFQNISRENSPVVNRKVSSISTADDSDSGSGDSGMTSNPEAHCPDTEWNTGSTGNTVLQELIRHRLDTALEDTLRKDRNYQESKQRAEAKACRLSKDMFTERQWELIDDALEENNASASEYGRAAYQQGIFDVLDLLSEILWKRRR